MKITPSNPNHNEFDIDVKRFYVPYILSGECPKCAMPFEDEFKSQYLSYPIANAPFDHGCWCSECNHEWKVGLILNVSLTLEAVDGA